MKQTIYQDKISLTSDPLVITYLSITYDQHSAIKITGLGHLRGSVG